MIRKLIKKTVGGRVSLRGNCVVYFIFKYYMCTKRCTLQKTLIKKHIQWGVSVVCKGGHKFHLFVSMLRIFCILCILYKYMCYIRTQRSLMVCFKLKAATVEMHQQTKTIFPPSDN